MVQEKRTNTENNLPIKADIYREFILWTAMPVSEKVKLGIETQGQFCEHFKIDKNTPKRWKERSDFEKRVDAILKMWSNDKTPDIIHSIYRTAVKGNPLSQKLWLQYFKKFTEKSEVTVTQKVEFGVNDVRFIIEGLPEPLRSEHYANLRKLIDDAVMVRNARDSEGLSWRDGPAPTISDDTDQTTQNIRGEGTYVVAESNQTSIRSDMGNQRHRATHTSASDYQSTERRWQE
jgi:hypothetical protein